MDIGTVETMKGKAEEVVLGREGRKERDPRGRKTWGKNLLNVFWHRKYKTLRIRDGMYGRGICIRETQGGHQTDRNIIEFLQYVRLRSERITSSRQ